jgi:hypothetical protein
MRLDHAVCVKGSVESRRLSGPRDNRDFLHDGVTGDRRLKLTVVDLDVDHREYVGLRYVSDFLAVVEIRNV